MKKYVFLLLSALSLQVTPVKADEGMWLPFLVGRNYEDMKKYGLNLSADQIYSINNSSLKDAVISFGGFCTGELISGNGLVLTNHHCGYGAIADVSTPEHNYLDNGFWARSHQEEIHIKGLHATFVIRIADVTKDVLPHLNDNMTQAQRDAKVAEIEKTLIEENTRGTHYSGFVRDFYDGNEYYMFITERFNDIRLVGTPPQSVGKYGGDTDNWMWPRHTADFSMFRIYSGADNKPAAYSTANVPFQPKHHLPISLKGVKENDFSMIMGFPGRTDRFSSSWAVEQTVSVEKPKRVEIRGMKLEVMKKHMDADVSVRLRYSSSYASTANYWKNFQGEMLQVKNNGVVNKKRELEKVFAQFAAGKDEYANVLSTLERVHKTLDQYVVIRAYQNEFAGGGFGGRLMMTVAAYKTAIEKGNEELADRLLNNIKGLSASYFETADMNLEKDIIANYAAMYLRDINVNLMDSYSASLAKKSREAVEKVIYASAKKSIFFNKEKMNAFLANPSLKAINKDAIVLFTQSLMKNFEAAMAKEDVAKANEDLKVANRSFIRGIRLAMPEKNFAPNANSTQRFTYGQVLSYEPKDGITYNYVTTLEGMFAKEDPTNDEFIVDEKLRETYLKSDFGQYIDKERNKLVVNFISNNDITGGNSGSPVINGDGQLIGTTFDGNWEAMSGNIFFEDKVQRAITCDIRYVLWLVDKVYGATNLINEMTLVK